MKLTLNDSSEVGGRDVELRTELPQSLSPLRRFGDAEGLMHSTETRRLLEQERPQSLYAVTAVNHQPKADFDGRGSFKAAGESRLAGHNRTRMLDQPGQATRISALARDYS